MPEFSYPSQQQEKFVLRLPDGMRDRIKSAATANNRSMNAEIVALLEERFPPPLAGNDAVRQNALLDLLAGATAENREQLVALANRVLAGDGTPARFVIEGDTIRLREG